MKQIVDWFVAQWSQSGNPAWFKILLLVALTLSMVNVVHTIKEYFKSQRMLDDMRKEAMTRHVR